MQRGPIGTMQFYRKAPGDTDWPDVPASGDLRALSVALQARYETCATIARKPQRGRIVADGQTVMVVAIGLDGRPALVEGPPSC